MAANPSGLLTHRAGRQSRMPGLSRFVAANPGTDPLVGNYVLVPTADTIMVGGGMTTSAAGPLLGFTTTVSDGTVAIAALDNSANQLAAIPAMTLARAVPLSVDNEQRDRLLLLYVSSDNHLWLYGGGQATLPGGTPALTLIPPAADAVDLGPYDHGLVHAVTGPFCSLPAGSNSMLLAVAWYSNATDLMLTVVTFNADGWYPTVSPGWSVKLATQTAGDLFDLAAGDFDGDGDWEVAVAYPQADGARVAAMLAVVDSTGETSPACSVSAPIAVGYFPPPPHPAGVYPTLSLAAGAFLASSTDEAIAVAWLDESYQLSCALVNCAAGVPVVHGHPWAEADFDSWSGGGTQSLSCARMSLAAGDLDLDGVDELVLGALGFQGEDPVLVLCVLTAGEGNPVSLAASKTIKQLYSDIYVQVGLLGAPGAPRVPGVFVLGASIFLGTPFTEANSAYMDLWAVPCTPGTFALTADWAKITQQPLPSWDFADNPDSISPLMPLPGPADFSLLLADLAGGSVRVGPPEQFTFDQIGQVLAIFNAPPAQANVNFSESGAMLTDTTTDVKDSHFTLNVHRSHTLSDEFSDNVGLSVLSAQINQSITNTYGENFSKTDDSGDTTTFSLMKTASVDDLIRVTYMPYTVWEYPVYAASPGGASGLTVVGYLLVMWPDLTQLATIELSGSGPLIGYAPDHQLGSVLSYPSSAPAAWNSANQVNQNLISLEVDTSVTSLTYDSTKSQTKTKTVQKDLGISINKSFSLSTSFQFLGDLVAVAADAADDDGGGGDGGGIDLGISFNSASHYTKSTASTHQVGFTHNSAIVITYPALTDSGATYTVTPYIYFTDDPAQVLVVDYSVAVPQSVFWQGVYGQPNPTFNFEQTQAPDPLSMCYTRSLAFTPFVTSQGAQAVQIAATVANYSFAPASGVLVEFFTERPLPADTGFQQATIAVLAPGERVTVSTDDQDRPIVWQGTPPASGQYIWARISMPKDASIAPVVGCNIYPPSAWQGGG